MMKIAKRATCYLSNRLKTGNILVPRMLIFHWAAETNAALWEIVRIGQEEQFASRKTSRSQLTVLINTRQNKKYKLREKGG